MAKHYGACGEESERWNATVVLQPKFWEQQQHKSLKGRHYARFMRPACHRFVLSTLTRAVALSPRFIPNRVRVANGRSRVQGGDRKR